MMDSYVATDQKIHLIAQLIAKVNRSYVPEKDDDSHTNLYLDPLRQKLLGRWFEIDKQRFIAALNLNSFELELVNESLTAVRSQKIDGLTFNEIEEQWITQLERHNFDVAELSQALHFEIPEYQFSKDAMVLPSQEEVRHWLNFRTLANRACQDVLGMAQVQGEVRIWPHHFDTGIYFELNSKLGIGFGLAMSDSILNQPYFYMSAYSKQGNIDFKKLPQLNSGAWISNSNYQGAVLGMEQVSGINGNSQHVLNSFIVDSFDTYLKQIARELPLR